MEIKNILEPSNDSKNIASLTWIGMIIFAFWVPLIVYLIKTDDDFVREHAKMSLNWSITALLAGIVGAVLSVIVIGILILVAAWVCNVIFGIMGAIAARNGEYYQPPMTFKILH